MRPFLCWWILGFENIKCKIPFGWPCSQVSQLADEERSPVRMEFRQTGVTEKWEAAETKVSDHCTFQKLLWPLWVLELPMIEKQNTELWIGLGLWLNLSLHMWIWNGNLAVYLFLHLSNGNINHLMIENLLRPMMSIFSHDELVASVLNGN